MKFGGSSLADATSVRRVVELVASVRQERPVVVVSAHAGVTDALLALARRAAAGAAAGEVEPRDVERRHREILRDLGLDADLLDPLLRELTDLLRGIRLVGERTARLEDHVVSFGERCSSRVVAAALCAHGVPAVARDAWDVGLRTDSAFGRARPLPDDGRIGAAIAACEGVPVVTGFLGKDDLGNVTTLGRNGSDFSAAWLGAALRVREIQIWKDVDGVRTADPRLCPDALPVVEMTFDEAAELSAFGSRVLHPATMAPARLAGIPVRVANTRSPAAPGTRIVPASPRQSRTVRAIAHRAPVALVTVVAQRILPQHAFLAEAFAALHRAEVDALLAAPSTGELTVAVAADEAGRAAAALAGVGESAVQSGQAVVGVVGETAAMAGGAAGRVLAVLERAGIPVRCAGSGARGATFAVAVPAAAAEAAVQALHADCFQASRSR